MSNSGIILKVPNGHTHSAEIIDLVLGFEHGIGIVMELGELNGEEKRITSLKAKLTKAIALLEQAECPDVEGGDRRCIGGFSHYLALTGKYNSLHECPFCADRKQLLGERG